MFKTVQEAFQYLVQQFRQNTGKFPIGKQIEDLMRQAEDYMSKPQITQVDETKLPRADIEALPLADKEKAEAAVRKKLEAQNVQAKQSREGGESSGGQRGEPELVDKNFGQTLYIDKSEMMMIMDDAQKKFDQARDAAQRGDYDEARGILRYEIEENYKLPQETRDAAYDARIFIRRGEGLAKDMGYDTDEEILGALDEQISKGIKTTYEDNWPLYTNPDDTSNMKSIEYVNFLDEAGEDFGTPNSQMITPADMDYEYAEGGRVGFVAGGAVKASQMLVNLYNKLVKDGKATRAVREFFEEKLSEIINIEKMGVTKPRDVENILKEAQEISKKQYQSKMEPIKEGDLEGVMSALPVDEAKVMKQRTKAGKDKEGIQQLADDDQIPVRDDTKPQYRFTGRETVDDLRDLEDKGIVSRSDINVYGDRYLDYLDARVKYYYGYTKGQMNKIKNQPARLNYLRAQVDPDWAEANFGEDYARILEKARGEEMKITNPGKDKSGPFDHIFEKMYKPVRDEIDEVDKIPGEEPLQKTKNKRTLNASGGLAYLMGL